MTKQIQFTVELPDQFGFTMLRVDSYGNISIGVKIGAPTAWGYVTGFGTARDIAGATAIACEAAERELKLAHDRAAMPVLPQGVVRGSPKDLGL